MDINATLLGQMITFAVFIWFTMKFVWPPIVKAMETRKKQIADGLAAAERGVRELELAKRKATEQIQEAKAQAASILEKANKRASHLVEEAKNNARSEGNKMLLLAKEEISQEYETSRHQLRKEAASLAIFGAEKIIARNLDADDQRRIVEEAIAKI